MLDSPISEPQLTPIRTLSHDPAVRSTPLGTHKNAPPGFYPDRPWTEGDRRNARQNSQYMSLNPMARYSKSRICPSRRASLGIEIHWRGRYIISTRFSPGFGHDSNEHATHHGMLRKVSSSDARVALGGAWLLRSPAEAQTCSVQFPNRPRYPFHSKSHARTHDLTRPTTSLPQTFASCPSRSRLCDL